MHPHHGSSQLSSYRAKKGKVAAAAMSLLKEHDMHGYQIIQELSERSGGAWSPSPGSVYPALQSLEKHGMVSSTEDDGRRVFSLTELGRKHAAMLPADAPWQEAARNSERSRGMQDAFDGLSAAVVQVGRVGDDDQIEKISQILMDARKRIYLVLAGDE